MNAVLIFRLLSYLVVSLLPLLHPAMAVFGDPSSSLLRFLIIPLAALLSFFLAGLGSGVPRALLGRSLPQLGRQEKQSFFLALAGLLVLPLLVLLPGGGAAMLGLSYSLTALVAAVTLLAFGAGHFVFLSFESLALLLFCYRFLDFARANSEIASASRVAITIGFLLLLLLFFIQSLLIYKKSFPAKEGPGKFLLAGGGLALLLLFAAFFLPSSFQDHQRIANSLEQILDPPPSRVVSGPQQLPGDGPGTGDGLGDSGNGDGNGGSQRTRMVMVVRAPVQPLYLAEGYFGPMNAVEGFQLDEHEELNDLFQSRKIETWQNPVTNGDAARELVPTEVFSTIPGQALAYLPMELEPTIINYDWAPIVYRYKAASAVSQINIHYAMPRYPAGAEAQIPSELSAYLQTSFVPQTQDIRRRLEEHLAHILPNKNASYDERISAILRSFSSYQYEIGYTDDVSTRAIDSFLFDTLTGDCTEFSNAAVLMARMLGIPARVVVGWAVSDSLRSQTHVQALELLQEQHPLLADIPLDELYLVTDAHHHSWAQFWLPGLGWVDFETTSEAIPPPAELDAANFDIVIPQLYKAGSPENLRFPWQLLGIASLSLAVLTWLAFLLARLLRYAGLWRAVRRRDAAGLRALYRLLRLRLAHRGFTPAKPGWTPLEYAQAEPRLAAFAQLYTRTYYAMPPDAPLPQGDFENLKLEYARIMAAAQNLRGQLSEMFNPREPGGAV